jgi:ubiquinone/menaquinone biosynthesis C-methylase UbiE
MNEYRSDNERGVAEHYRSTNLAERLLAMLEPTGQAAERLTIDDLSGVDEFHIGGSEATKGLAAKMALQAGMKVLDIGCGIGGPARYFASTHNCEVAGIDLTPEYIRTAKVLSDRVGMGDQVTFEAASALRLPFEAARFDAAYMIHVGMNIADKQALFLEVRSVLRRGAVFAIYDVMRLESGELSFPQPWTSSAAESFVASPAEYREALTHAGFQLTEENEKRQAAIEFFERMQQQAGKRTPQAMGVRLVMGETAAEKFRNLAQAVRAGVLAPVEIIARRSSNA